MITRNICIYIYKYISFNQITHGFQLDHYILIGIVSKQYDIRFYLKYSAKIVKVMPDDDAEIAISEIFLIILQTFAGQVTQHVILFAHLSSKLVSIITFFCLPREHTVHRVDKLMDTLIITVTSPWTCIRRLNQRQIDYLFSSFSRLISK